MHRKEPGLPRREFLRLAGAGAAASLLGLPPAVAREAGDQPNPQVDSLRHEKPNFLIFYTDDQGWGDMGCYGASDFRTPNMNALAASGVRFTSWYSNAPVCSASRAALLTGRYPQRAGAPGIFGSGRAAPGMPPDEITLAEVLKGVGYRTGLMGKWHLGGGPEFRPNQQGFDDFFGFHSGCIDNYSHIYYWGQGGKPARFPFHDLWRNDKEVWENGQFFTELTTREAVRFVGENRSRPFFLYVAWNLPHYPTHPPARYWERAAHIKDPERRTQAACVAAVDDSMGQVMAELRRAGLLERTLVFFSSDNGPSAEQRNLLDDSGRFYYGGSAGPFRGHKFSLFEGGIRMPTLMSWPGTLPKGKVIEDVGVTMDIFPTFVHLAGAELPADRVIDGKDVFPMIAHSAPSPHETIFWANANQRAVRRGKWKLILNPTMDPGETAAEKVFLADLEKDPGEKANLAEKNAELAKELMALIGTWEKDVEKKRR
jgi:arylsulfatase A-like enzyme